MMTPCMIRIICRLLPLRLWFRFFIRYDMSACTDDAIFLVHFLQVFQHEFGPLKILCHRYNWFIDPDFVHGTCWDCQPWRISLVCWFWYCLIWSWYLHRQFDSPRVCICMILKCLTLWFIPVMISFFIKKRPIARDLSNYYDLTDFNNWHSWYLLMLLSCTYQHRLPEWPSLVLDKMDGRKTTVR